jgi:spermidine synthase
MLVLGGGVEGVLKELLRHGPESLDYVTLDRREHEIVVEHLAEPDRLAIQDVRIRVHLEDARRFVKRAAETGDAHYNLVILAAPQPTSAMLARLYTAEFFAELSRIMAADGVLVLSLTGSVGAWGAEVSNYVGSIVTPLERVFAQVLLTFGDPARIFAAKQEGVVTGSGASLAERYNARQVTSPVFSPIWFEGASDFLDPEKRELVRNALATQPPRFFNSDARPVAALYRLRLWSVTTGSAHQGKYDLVSSILEVRLWWVFAAVPVCLVIAVLAVLVRRKSVVRHTALLWSVGTTGFTALAIEIVLLYTLQVLYGYVYGMIGLAIGVFMFGLVIGSAVMNRYVETQPEDGAERHSLTVVVALDVLLVFFAALLPVLLGLLRTFAEFLAAQAALFSLIGVMGVLGGMVIPVAALLRLHDNASTARAASAVDAADHTGAGVGALVTGVILVPVLGISGTCLVVALMKGLSALFLAGAAVKGSAEYQTAPLSARSER